MRVRDAAAMAEMAVRPAHPPLERPAPPGPSASGPPAGPAGDEAAADRVGVDRERLQRAMEKLDSAGAIFNRSLRFRVHEGTHRIMVQVISEDGTVVKEIPPKKLLDVLAAIQEAVGLLFDEIA